jgi:flagellar protein FliO/FliZ
MFDTSLFGTELPGALRVIIVFLLVLGLIGATTWAVRRFGGGRLGVATNRGRQPRLAVIDAAPVDTRRRLILIRRDNVEHLLMIGGPTDIVVEANIVRAVAASREAPGARAAASDRSAVAPVDNTMWPLQPETMTPRAPRAAEEPWQQPEPAPRQRSAEPLAGLAAELSRPVPPAEPREAKPSPERKTRVEAARATEAEPARATDAEPARTAAPPQPAPVAELPAPADKNLAEMAQRLEAALRRPTASAAKPAGAVDPESKNETVVSLAARAEAGSGTEKPAREAKAGRGEPKPAKGLYDSLEQEMASLLGRPAARQ